MKRLQIVFVNQYAFPDEAATAQMLSDLVKKCEETGFGCHVICSDRSYADRERRYDRTEVVGRVGYSRVRTTSFGREGTVGRVLNYLTFLLGALLRLLSGPRPDVIVGMSTPPVLGALAVLVAKLRRCRSVYWAMDVYPDIAFALGAMDPRGAMGSVFGIVSGWTLREANLVLALGDTMAARLRGLGARHVLVVHNWADGSAIQPRKSDESLWRRRQRWDGKLAVVYSGNMGLAHEFETLLEAASLLGEQARFVFVGDGPRRRDVEDGSRRRCLLNVEFHDAVPRERLSDLLAAGDVHVVTLRPGLPGLLVPSKVYGILAAGRPIVYVGPTEGEVFEIVSGGGCGACIENGRASELAEVLRAYGEESQRRVEEGARGREMFEMSFAKERQTFRIIEALQALAQE